MADYIYLLENRLSAAQQAALLTVRQVARTKGLTVFLVGGAVRDMTSGSPVRDLDVVVQGNALKLKKDIEKAKGVITGEHEAGQSLFVRFPGGVRMEIGSTLSVTYPKPGKPAVKPATILEDLRRRDFTANAMALSLNDGSYGLLMDPLNGVADIENRELRLVSNYGFIEDPVRMIRAARFMARLGWQMDERTQQRYETGKQEGYIEAMDQFHRGYETEEIFHEEDPLRVLRRLEAEGWMKHLFPALSSSKANVAELDRLRESQMQLQMQGIHPEAAVANFPLLTAKMAPEGCRRAEEELCPSGICSRDRRARGRGQGLRGRVRRQRCSNPIAGLEAAALGQARVNPVGRAHLEELRNPGQVQRLLHRMGAGQTEDPLRPYAGDAHRSRPADLQRAGGQALLRADGQQAGHGRRDEGVSRALLAARSSAARASAPSAHGQEGCQASQEPQEGCGRRRRRADGRNRRSGRRNQGAHRQGRSAGEGGRSSKGCCSCQGSREEGCRTGEGCASGEEGSCSRQGQGRRQSTREEGCPSQEGRNEEDSGKGSSEKSPSEKGCPSQEGRNEENSGKSREKSSREEGCSGEKTRKETSPRQEGRKGFRQKETLKNLIDSTLAAQRKSPSVDAGQVEPATNEMSELLRT